MEEIDSAGGRIARYRAEVQFHVEAVVLAALGNQCLLRTEFDFDATLIHSARPWQFRAGRVTASPPGPINEDRPPPKRPRGRAAGRKQARETRLAPTPARRKCNGRAGRP